LDIAFVINATSKIADEAFDVMKRTIEKIIEKHGDKPDKYQIIIHGDDSNPRAVCFDDLKELERGSAKSPALHEDLRKVEKHFCKSNATPAAKVGIHS